MDPPVALYVSVPVACFRVPQAREYFETLPCPAPSTVYGMLLSLAGEPNRLAHKGAEVALALLNPPPARSVVLRTLWRVKDKDTPPGVGENKRPDFQELLTGVRLVVWTRPGEKEEANPPLAERVHGAIEQPARSNRFGALSLGESTHLVDEARRWRRDDGTTGQILARNPEGDLTLPVWADHVGSAGTRWGQYQLREGSWTDGPPPEAWTPILPP
ncbi:MAG: type I-MYXAN CRISPR-associated protein Cas5/Cmx5/DevS [Halobacteria archaeon]